MLFKFLTNTDVKKNLTISVIGTGLGQLIHLGTTPILSRIYTPETFGQFSLFISFLGILTAFSLFKFDLGIITADEKDIYQIKRILNLLTFITTIIVAIVTFFLGLKGHDYFVTFIFLTLTIPIGNRFWLHRAIMNKAGIFKKLSLGKIFENGTNSLTAIALGLANLKDYGLFIGKFFGILVTYLFFRSTTKKLYKEKPDLSVKETFQKYSNYPKFSFPAELVGHFNLSSAIFLFTYFFSSLEVGLIGLTTRVMAVPANFVSISFFDVFKQKAVLDYKETGSFDAIFRKFFFVLFSLAFAMILLIYFTGPILFTTVFGDEWYKAGVYAKYLCILYAVRLVAGPLVFSFEITNKHFVNLIFQSLYLIFGASSILVTYYITKSDLACIISYSITLSLLYSLHIIMAYLNSICKKTSYVLS